MSGANEVQEYLDFRKKIPVALRFDSDKKFEIRTGYSLRIYRIPLKFLSESFFKKKDVIH